MTGDQNEDPPLEIERKFLLKRLPEGFADSPGEVIEQGYLAVEKGGIQVRLRKRGERLYLAFKRGEKMSREEREVTLSAEQFEMLWPATEGRRLIKIRHEIPWQKHTVEIDVYRGRHDGLIVAEVEFADEKSCSEFVAPSWFGADVTGDRRYSNIVLAETAVTEKRG